MSKIKKLKRGNVTSPKGFLAAGLYCGIKKSGKKDLAVVYSEKDAVCAALFTTNRVQAWPVIYSRKVINRPTHRAILATSGNANCVNGINGKRALLEGVRLLSRELGVGANKILVVQTGVIGRPFPLKALRYGIPQVACKLSPAGGKDAAQAILTTDTRTKEVAYKTKIGSSAVQVGAIAKGSGMIHPQMATLLCFITTDVAISKPLLKKALREIVGPVFNSLAIDNDMSTNDTVFVLANGAAGNKKIVSSDQHFEQFKAVLKVVAVDIARKLIADAEGGTRVAEIVVSCARSDDEALCVARHIGTSMLFKTMLAGADPNMGRVVACIGSSGANFSLKRLTVSFDGVCVFRSGRHIVSNLKQARQILRKKSYQVKINLGVGKGQSVFLTSDLTKAYVQINSAYST